MAVAQQYQTFKHAPLDTTQQSIRLVSIDPVLTPNGLLQCTISHTIVAAHYNCLSYVWGTPDQSHTLIVDGKALTINKNLHDFLAAVRTFKYREKRRLGRSHLRHNLWIDAICIDQSSNNEKTHQVAQMGKVYANACKVIMWLGDSHGQSSGRVFDSGTRSYLNFIWENKYWTRAWVVQEVLLAKDPVMLVADRLIPVQKFVRAYVDIDCFAPDTRARLRVFGHTLLRQTRDKEYYKAYGVLRAWVSNVTELVEGKIIWKSRKITKQVSITEWLSDLPGIKSALVQDRIFSLLAMAEEGSRIPVNYHMPLVELVDLLFKARSHGICLCELLLVIEVLDITDEVFENSLCARFEYGGLGEANDCPSLGRLVRSNTLPWPSSSYKTSIKVPVQALQFPAYGTICENARLRLPLTPVQIERSSVTDWEVATGPGYDLESDYRAKMSLVSGVHLGIPDSWFIGRQREDNP